MYYFFLFPNIIEISITYVNLSKANWQRVPRKSEIISEPQDKKPQNTAGFSLGIFAEDTNVLVKNS